MTLLDLLGHSRATPVFAAAVAEFLRSNRSSDHLQFGPGCPPVKVERTLMQILKASPDLEIERIEVRATSGCEYFRGELIAYTPDAPLTVRFEWNCKWRAQQQGWTDYFGFPDQARAAREFGHDCFRTWNAMTMEPISVLA
ncbi:hypothetical protein BH23GEM6_BH23GEM6_05120 [soil metagenome]